MSQRGARGELEWAGDTAVPSGIPSQALRQRMGAVRRRQKSRDQGGRWTEWLTTSGLLHLALLGVLATLPLIGPATVGKFPASLRVRLLPETQQSPVHTPTINQIPSPPSQSPPMRGRQFEPAGAGTPPPQGGGRPMDGRPKAGTGSMEPVTESNGRQMQGQPAGPVGEGPIQYAFPRRGTGEVPVDPDPALAVLPAGERTQGILFLQEGGSSGTGWSGPGAADHGSGRGGGGLGTGSPGGTAGSSGGSAGIGVASRGGTGSGAGGGASLGQLLQTIRRRVEQARIYPEAARRGGFQGTVDLRFRIAADGSVEAFEILRSSGFRILDEASEQTIRRAAPYPPVSGWIRLPLSYRLQQ
jgi:TonB family protein